jgi:hypothetical protein
MNADYRLLFTTAKTLTCIVEYVDEEEQWDDQEVFSVGPESAVIGCPAGEGRVVRYETLSWVRIGLPNHHYLPM